MRYEDAKKEQVSAFKEGRYFVIRQDEESGEYSLIQAASRAIAQDSIRHDLVAVVARMPTRLRVLKSE